MDDPKDTFQHRSTRTTGNDPTAGADPGGTRSTYPGQRDKHGPKAQDPELDQRVSSGDRNPKPPGSLRKPKRP